MKKFFAWWKRRLKVYHLISISRHGLMIQMLAGLDHLHPFGHLLP